MTEGPLQVGRPLREHWPDVERIYVERIYVEGIATGDATFETAPPTWEAAPDAAVPSDAGHGNGARSRVGPTPRGSGRCS